MIITTDHPISGCIPPVQRNADMVNGVLLPPPAGATGAQSIRVVRTASGFAIRVDWVVP
jgi:hypothetical protein